MNNKLSLFFFLITISMVVFSCNKKDDTPEVQPVGATYFVDSENGIDTNDGLTENTPWKTLAKVEQTELKPGDIVRFKRGSIYTGPLIIKNSGTQGKYITLTDYGDQLAPAPAFTNPVFEQDNFGNCIRLKGDYVVVSNLYFYHTATFKPGIYQTDGWVTWEMGAVYIDKGAQYCVVKNCEMFDCPVGIKSYGENAVIEYNYVHDCNREMAEWNWGPLGIWLGADYQEVRYNKVINISAVDPRIDWGNGYGGADGGAFEIDDARRPKSHISIHHNYTRECQGFLEITGSDVVNNANYTDFNIHHNVSDDYQEFMAIWRGANFRIENNTILRRHQNACDWGVFNITQNNSQNLIQNNIIVVENNTRVFNVGLGSNNPVPSSIIKNNLYYAASGALDIGKEGPGLSPVYGDPKFVNYSTANKAEDLKIQANSPAIDKGLSLGYDSDFIKTHIPFGTSPDLGAFEFNNK